MADARYIFVVEHLDPELGPWSALEYKTIAQESKHAGCRFILSSVPESLLKTQDLQTLRDAGAEGRNDSIETYFADRKDRICLLDPAAKQELATTDANQFDVFLFGGILGKGGSRGESLFQNSMFQV
jgi:ribosome biogenesis SPOUT family RNA methylase Rps3